MDTEQIDPKNELSPSIPTAKKPLNISVPAAIITGAAIIAIAIMLAFGRNDGNATKPIAPTNPTPKTVSAEVAKVRAEDYVRGDRNAQVAIIEYSDSDCPFCEQFHKTMQDTLAAYNGQVSWTYRFFPLTTLHPNAYSEAVALQCVGELGGQKAFWLFLDTIIGMTLTPGVNSDSTLASLALQNDVDGKLYDACVQSKTTASTIDTAIAEAKSIGARGTPFSIAVNTTTGKQVVIPGAVSKEYLKEIIDSLLK